MNKRRTGAMPLTLALAAAPLHFAISDAALAHEAARIEFSALDQRVKASIPAQALSDTVVELCKQAHLSCVPFTDERLARSVPKGVTIGVALAQVLDQFGYTFVMPTASSLSIRAREDAALPEVRTALAAAAHIASGDARSKDEVVIRGSSLRENPFVSQLSLVEIGRKEIEASGVTTTGDLLRRVTLSYGSGKPDTSLPFSTWSGFGNGNWGDAIDLRGLGPQSTLVLINGKRPPRSAGGKGGYFDTSTLPLEMIERIEILLDGSSVYFGPDALAGVVNIIVPVVKSGWTTSMRAGWLSQGGGNSLVWTQRAGAHLGKLDAGLAYQGSKRAPVDSQSTPATRDTMQFGYPQADISPRQHQDFFLANMQWSFDERTNLRVDGSYVVKSMVGRYSSEAFGGVDVVTDAETRQRWATLAFVFALPFGWQGQFDGGAGDNELRSILVQTPHSNEPLKRTEGRDAYGFRYADLHTEGELINLVRSKPQLTLDFGTRIERYRANEPVDGDGSLRSDHVFAGIAVPIRLSSTGSAELPTLTLRAADRYERQSAHASTVYTTSVELSLLPALQFSVSTGKSIRAPLPSEVYLDRAWQLLEDIPNASPGVPWRVLARFGPNADLLPEVARTMSATVEYRTHAPVDMQLRANLFRVKISSGIGAVQAQFSSVLQDPAYASVRTLASETPRSEMIGLVNRLLTDPSNGMTLGCAGPVGVANVCLEDPADVAAVLDMRELNLTETMTDGLDFQLRIAKPFGTKTGTLTLAGTRLFHFESRATPDAPAVGRTNTLFYPPALRLEARTELDSGPYGVASALSFVNSYTNNLVSPHARIESRTTLDLTFRFSPERSGTTYRLSIMNVLDAYPPHVSSENGFNYDPRNADFEGRSVQLTIEKKWALPK